MTQPQIDRLRSALAGRYTVERELGAGGMATVYLADDAKHGRKVALKVLRPEFTAALGEERFNGEIRTTARLTHPHILALFDSGEADGLFYYVMPFIDGETLRDRLLREGRLGVDDALRIAREVSDALAYAHAQGVVHRDIKPENILLQSGHALVADFGIARVLDAASSRMTATGVLLGTPLYMSPEQATGDVIIDGRSDVYSLACVLFEMLTGEAPFTGATMASIIAQRFTHPTPSAITRRNDISERLDTTLKKALARDPGERVESATRFTEMLAAAMTAAATVAARAETPKPSEPCIAVLPFANMSNDPDAEFFSDGMTEEILNALTKLRGLKVIARTSSFAFKGQNVDVREIGKRLGAGHVLEGSVRKAGNRLRITAQLIDARDGVHLWSEKYDREMNDVFAIQDEITAAIRDELSRHLHIGEVTAHSTPQIDPETYELFLRGRYLVDQRAQGIRQGLAILMRVVQRAPNFAPGFAALASAHSMSAFYCTVPSKSGFGTARDYAKRALAIDPDLGQATLMLAHAALYVDWDWPAALIHYQRASEGASDYWTAGAGGAYFCSLGRFDDALARGVRAVSADPVNPSALTQPMWYNYLARRFDLTVSLAENALEIAPTYSETHRWKAMGLLQLGHLEDARRSMEEAVRLSGRHVWSVSVLSIIYRRLGRTSESDALVAELETRSASEAIPPYAFLLEAAPTHAARDRAFAWLDRSIEARDFWLVNSRVEPLLDFLRDDPRFDDAIQRIGIPPVGS
jgi:serine/threonine-protein kinase